MRGETDKDSSAVPASDLESGAGDALLGAEAVAGLDTSCRIHIHSLRRRPVDPDGISGKAVIDGIVHAGILRNDSSEFVSQVTYSQEQGEMEETIITLTWQEGGDES